MDRLAPCHVNHTLPNPCARCAPCFRQVYNTTEADSLLFKWFQKRLRLDRLLHQQQQVAEAQQALRDDVAAAIEEADRRLAELEEQRQNTEGEEGDGLEGGELEEDDNGKPPCPKSKGGPTAWHARACGWASAPPSAAQQEKRAEQLKARAEKLAVAVQKTERQLADLQGRYDAAQQDAAESHPAPCFFATFHTAHAAAYAARLNLNPLHERMMR